MLFLRIFPRSHLRVYEISSRQNSVRFFILFIPENLQNCTKSRRINPILHNGISPYSAEYCAFPLLQGIVQSFEMAVKTRHKRSRVLWRVDRFIDYNWKCLSNQSYIHFSLQYEENPPNRFNLLTRRWFAGRPRV